VRGRWRARLPKNSVTDLSPHLTDFADTATAMAHLDLVITVDTAVAHLAGALARPAWVILRSRPDWRWLLARDDSPWYPTLRFYRQPRPGDWDDVISRVTADLVTLVADCKRPLG
jgi:ADP-heptose:LPS heptosyltransferase